MTEVDLAERSSPDGFCLVVSGRCDMELRDRTVAEPEWIRGRGRSTKPRAVPLVGRGDAQRA